MDSQIFNHYFTTQLKNSTNILEIAKRFQEQYSYGEKEPPSLLEILKEFIIETCFDRQVEIDFEDILKPVREVWKDYASGRYVRRGDAGGEFIKWIPNYCSDLEILTVISFILDHNEANEKGEIVTIKNWIRNYTKEYK